MIYLDHFQLDRRPFARHPDPSFMFWTRPHKQAFKALQDAVRAEKPLTLLSGEGGAGKTMLVASLANDIRTDQKFRPCLMRDPRIKPDAMLRQIITTCGFEPATEDLWASVWANVARARKKGLSLVVIVDDAHLLSIEGASTLAKLSRAEGAPTSPVPVVLAGMPSVTRQSDLPACRVFKEDIGREIDLAPLEVEGVGPYINSRLQTVGAPKGKQIFDADTFQMIHKATGGLPGEINRLCEICLFLAGDTKAASITTKFLKQVLVSYKKEGSDDISLEAKEVIVLQEPERKQAPPPMPQIVEPQPTAPAKPSPPKTVSPPIVSVERRKWPVWLGLGVSAAAAMAYGLTLLDPASDVPPGAANDTAVAEAPPDRPEAETPPEDAPTSLADLPTLTYAHDPVADPVAPYFERAIAATDPRARVIAYTRAAIRGHERSALYLGQLFDTGDGTVFAPDVAARWYAVAENPPSLGSHGPFADLAQDGQATPLFSAVTGAGAEFVWEGRADRFRLEIGDQTKTALAQYTTPLTSALVNLPQDAAFWRVWSNTTQVSEWIPIAVEHGG